MPDTVVSVKLWPFGAIPISRNKGLALGYWIDIIIWVENSPRAKANVKTPIMWDVPCPSDSATGIIPNVASEELFLLQKCNCMAMSCCCPLNHVTSNRIKSWTGENHLNSDLCDPSSTVHSKPDWLKYFTIDVINTIGSTDKRAPSLRERTEELQWCLSNSSMIRNNYSNADPIPSACRMLLCLEIASKMKSTQGHKRREE